MSGSIPPTIVTLTGPSCTGKSTIEDALAQIGFSKAVSSTTRYPPRPGEIDGKAYYFLSDEKFDLITENAGWIEMVEFVGAKYGMSEREIERLDRDGQTIVIVCEPNGAGMIREWCGRMGRHHFGIFITNPLSVLVSRMLERATYSSGDTPDKAFERRLENLFREFKEWGGEGHYDLHIDSPDSPVDTAVSISRIVHIARNDFIRAKVFDAKRIKPAEEAEA